jgi:hypothetical protein
MFTPGMTTANACQRQPAATEKTVHSQNINSIGRAGGTKAAASREKGRNQKLISPNQKNQRKNSRLSP